MCLAQPDPLTSAASASSNVQPGLSQVETDLVLTRSRTLANQGKRREAIELLVPAATRDPQNQAIEEQLVFLLVDDNRLAQAEKVVLGSASAEVVLASLREKIETKLQKIMLNDKLVTVIVQKRMDLHDFDTAILVLDRALAVFPNKKADFFTLKGESLYKQNRLELAEDEFRKALNINPLNPVAKGYVTEIRTTLEAQTSTALAEWISIAKDKLGDFVVTFLALFTAFAVNSLIAPIALRVRLMQARRSFEMGDYDDFADLLETLLDKEDFKPLRQNFRSLLRSGDYHEIRSIFEKHVMTLERLPTLLRILEREHEKLSE
jgi:tetratricopeptide (TPR) repeat protein